MSIGVIPTSEARSARHSGAFPCAQGLLAEPMVFGGHRKPEGVVLPYELSERLLPAIEDVALAESVRERLARNEEPVDFDSCAADNGFDVEAYRASQGR